MDPLTVFVGIGGMVILLALGGGMVFMVAALFRPTPDYRAKHQPAAAPLCGPFCRDWNFTGWSAEQIREWAQSNPIPVQRVDDIEHLIGEVITPQKQTQPAPRRNEPAALPRGQSAHGLPSGEPARSLPAGGKQRSLPEGERERPIPAPNWPVRNPAERRRK